ncbi:hypothetical protein LBMAG57_29590 [Verrucomicrobiota bacterium]|nr:hypothetical protein LBMAG57_29590 [Verrucomicrobiota bacterium]
MDAQPPTDITEEKYLIGRMKLIFEPVPLALQTDSTRVITSSFRAAVTCRSWTA